MADEVIQSKSFVGNILNPVLDILFKVAEGDFSVRLKVLKKKDEFNELFVLINRIIDILKEYKQEAEGNKIKAKNTKELYEQILSYMDNGVFLTDKDDLITYANNGMGEITGSEPQEMEGKIVLRDFSQVSLKSFRPFYIKAKKTLNSVFYESVPIVYSPQRSIYQSGWLIPVIKDNKYDGMICTAVDVTKRKNAEEGQKESEEKLKKIFDANPSITFITGLNGYFVDANPAFLNLFDLSIKEIKKKNAMDIFVGTEEENFKHAIDRLKNGEEVRELEVQGKIASGEKRTFEINAIPIMENGKIESILYAARDITDRNNAIKELQTIQHRFKNVFDSAVVSLWEEDYSDVFSLIEDLKSQGVTDFEKHLSENPIIVAQAAQKVKILDVNQETLKLFGAKDKEEMLKFLSIIFVPEITEKFKDQLIAMAQGKDSFKTEFVMKNLKGEKIHVLGGLALPKNYSESKNVIMSVTDITEHKQAQERLESSEERLKILFERAPDAIFVNDFEGNLLDGNKAAEELVGYRKEDLIGKNFLDLNLLPSEYIEKAIENMAKNMKGIPTGLEEYIIKHKNGKLVPTEISTYPVNIDGQDVALSIARDITKRKNVETSLRESEERYRSLFDNMLNGFAYHVIVLDDNDKPIDYVFLEVNDTFESLTGLQGKDIIGKQVTDVIPGIENDPADWIGKYGKVALTGSEIKFEQYAEALDKWFSVSAYCPKKGYFATIFEDITPHKKAEESLKESEEKLRKILESSPDSITVTDLNGNIIECNEATLNMYRFSSKDEIIGKSGFDLIAPIDQQKAKKSLDMSLKPQETVDNEFTLVTKDGHEFLAEVSSGIIRNSQGDPTSFVIVAKDISEHKEADNKLKEKIQELERFRNITLNRELKMVELKNRIKKFERKKR